MEHDPRTRQAAAEEAAAAEGEPTDGVHSAAEADAVPGAAPDADGASGPAAASAGAAGVKQAADDAPEPEPAAPAADAAVAEPDYRDQYLRAMAELDNVRKRARRDVSQ